MAAGFVENKAAQPQTGKGWPPFQEISQCMVNFFIVFFFVFVFFVVFLFFK